MIKAILKRPKTYAKIVENNSINVIKTPRDDLSLFYLNKSKLKKIFNSHWWKTVEGVPIIDFNEWLKILKRLNVYPQLIANYDLKLVFSKDSDQWNSQMDELENWKISQSSITTNTIPGILKESNWDKINLSRFQNLFFKHLGNKFDQMFAFMSQGWKEYYGFSFYTKNSRIMTQIGSNDCLDSSSRIKKDFNMKTPNLNAKRRYKDRLKYSNSINDDKI